MKVKQDKLVRPVTEEHSDFSTKDLLYNRLINFFKMDKSEYHKEYEALTTEGQQRLSEAEKQN